MAAIDKLYLDEYYKINQLRTWAIIYYPKLLQYFYDYMIIEEDFEKWREEWVNDHMEFAERDYKQWCDGKTHKESVDMMYHYKMIEYRGLHSDRYIDDILEELKLIKEHHDMTKEDWEKEYSLPVMNTPFKVDRKLKWICPLPFIREYLHEQCGVNPKWEWFYKLFWKGKSLWK